MSIQVEASSRTEAEAQKALLETSDKERVKNFLYLGLTRFKAAAEHEGPGRKESLDDFKFSIGEQWPKDILADREADARPCLTMDHLNQSIKQVTNELREQRPSLQIDPAGDGGSRKIADIFQGMCRHVEVMSDAEVHYDIVGDHMVRGGQGFLRVYSEYLPGDTFDQEVKIESIRNPFLVYSDPFTSAPDGSDARYRFVIEDMARAEFEKEYPGTAASTLSSFESVGDYGGRWITKESVRVADYYYVEEEKHEIVRLPDGSIVPKDRLTEEEKALPDLETREVTEKVVKYAKITATDILDERTLPGTVIPIIPAVGDDLVVDGKIYRAGLIRNAKEPQRMYNYQCSAATEMVALAPRAPYIGAVGSFKSREAQWKSLNRRNFPYLEYDPVVVGGVQIGKPERNVAEPPIQATVLLIRQASDDLKASMGIYDASLGQPGPEQSGKAILARQKQGDKATLNFSDNLRRTIRAVGRVLMEWFPVIYDAPRIQRIINPDNSHKNVGIYNSQTSDYSPDEALQELQAIDEHITDIYDIGVGRYSVVVSAGANAQSKRQEAVSSIMALVQSYPNLMEVAGDLLIANMDWPYAELIAKRLKKKLPPELLEDDGTPEAQVTKLQAQLQQIGQQHDLLTKALTEATELIKSKKLELESKERIALFQDQTQLIVAQLKVEGEAALANLKAHQTAIQSRLELVHDSMTIDQEAQNDMDLATHQASLEPPEESTGQGEGT